MPATLERAAERCAVSRVGAPVLRRLTRRQIENTYRDAFPQLGSEWSGFALNDVSSALGFNNDSSVLVVSLQTSEQLLASTEQLADLLTHPVRIAALAACASNQLDGACAEQVLSTGGERLFRRALRADELQQYTSLYKDIATASDDRSALKWSLVALLQSPHTLYRTELGDLASDKHELDAHELASELSYTFTDSPPDAELRQLAARGELARAEVRVAQAERLLQTERGHEVVREFFRQWLRYGSVGTADRPLVPGFAAVRGKLIEETERFIEQVVYRDEAGLRGLLTSQSTLVDAELAAYYGYNTLGMSWTSVLRPAGQGIGVLAQGALLASASNVAATSPTQRGLRVLERLLCQSKPRPPANVPPLESSDPSSYRTTRQHYEQAHARGACAGCHVQFDPLGFAFEHFDSGGRYRTEEAGEPIDASGEWRELAFADQEQFVEQLASSAQVSDCVSGLLVQYALGGAGGAVCLAEDARTAFREGASWVDTFAQLAATEHFVRRTMPDGDAEPSDAGAVADSGKRDAGETAAADSGIKDAGAADDPLQPASNIGVVAQYRASNTAAKDNVIGPYLQIVHRGSTSIALETLQLRYYLSNEHAARCPDACLMEGYYAGIHPAGTGVTAARSYVAIDGDHAYLAIGFAPGSPELRPGESVEVQQQFHTSSYEDFDETDDYSFDATLTAYTDAEKVAIYQDGKRVWGAPPAW
jgi:hypothetical protein